MSSLLDSPQPAAQIAIVGSGPSGCYAAQFLRKLCPGVRIAVFERLPVPFGLVRYGVAPDHGGTKAVDRQFDRLFSHSEVEFFGNVELGRDISLEQLRDMFDVVVLATGLSGDRELEVPGASLSGVYGAGRVTRLFNEHPDEQFKLPRFGSRVAVVGNGNVALDVVRLLVKPSAAFAGSDLSEENLRRLVAERVRHIDVVGRSAITDAKFDPLMLRELGKVPGVRFLAAHHFAGEEAAAQPTADGGPNPRVAALEFLTSQPPTDHTCTVHFHLGVQPLRLEGRSWVERLVVEPSGAPSGAEAGATTFAVDSVVTAIGFDSRPNSPLSRDALIESDADLSVGKLGRGLYCAGWFHRGPQGTIPANRVAARAVAEAIAEYLDSGRRPGKRGAAALPGSVRAAAVGYQDWQRIDAAERGAAPADRSRQKIREWSLMLAVARGEHSSIPTPV